MTYTVKYDGVLYKVGGKTPPPVVVLPDCQVIECAWTHRGNGAQAYDINLVKHDKMKLKPYQVADSFNAPLAHRADSK